MNTCNKVEWTRPAGWRDAPTRRGPRRPRRPAGGSRAGLGYPFADAPAVRDRHAGGLIQLDAVTGLRWSEAVVLTVDPTVAAAAEGNLLDLAKWELAVTWQLRAAAARAEQAACSNPRALDRRRVSSSVVPAASPCAPRGAPRAVRQRAGTGRPSCHALTFGDQLSAVPGP